MAAMSLPTFVIGGARKAGTTALWAFLSEHPQVWMSPIKEPHFLTRDPNHPAPGVEMIGAPRALTYDRGLVWYRTLFEEGANRLARGEASTSYLGATDTPQIMEELVPGLKVIFVLRDPVDRAYSDYWHNQKKGHRLPPFEKILDDEPALRYLLYMSHYRPHLERYMQSLGADRLHLVLFDDLRANPSETFRDICRFIGVDDTFQPDFKQEHNPHGEAAIPLLQRAITGSTYRRWTFLPTGLRRQARRARAALETWNLKRTAYPAIDPALHDRLLDEFADDVHYVESMTRPLPEWWRRESEAA
jgi:hypothetical protein